MGKASVKRSLQLSLYGVFVLMTAFPAYPEPLNLQVDPCTTYDNDLPITAPVTYNWYRKSLTDDWKFTTSTRSKRLTVLVPSLGHFVYRATCIVDSENIESPASNELKIFTDRISKTEQ